MTFRLEEKGTKFALPILCPGSGEEVSAETLYNRCCDATGRVVTDHIGDLVLDNLDYSNGKLVSDEELCASVYSWADKVHFELRKAGYGIG